MSGDIMGPVQTLEFILLPYKYDNKQGDNTLIWNRRLALKYLNEISSACSNSPPGGSNEVVTMERKGGLDG